MPNQHSADKEILGFYVPQELATKLRGIARRRGLPLTQILTEVLEHGTKDTPLTVEELTEVKNTIAKRKQKQRIRISRDKDKPGP